jgi:predicted nucleic acid-binding protein
VKDLVLDSHALVSFLERQTGWEVVADAFVDAAAGESRLLMSVVNWGEVCYVTQRVHGTDALESVIAAIDELPLDLIEIDRALAQDAARLKAGGGLAYADCFAAALALQRRAPLLTGDREFERVAGEVEIKWIG